MIAFFSVLGSILGFALIALAVYLVWTNNGFWLLVGSIITILFVGFWAWLAAEASCQPYPILFSIICMGGVALFIIFCEAVFVIQDLKRWIMKKLGLL